jgi:hypothetical protein
MVVVDAAKTLQLLPQSQLPLEHCASAGTEVDAPIFTGLRPIAIDSGDPRLGDTEGSVYRFEI